MSRWAEMFASLSAMPDTVDSVDSVAEAAPASALSEQVSQSVNTVRTPASRQSASRKPAESLGFIQAGELTVNCVNSVRERENGGAQEPRGSAYAAGPSVRDIVDTVDTVGAVDGLERAAIVEAGTGVPRSWAEGYAALCAMPPPTGFSPERWARVTDAAGIFLDRWAVVAIASGWTDLDVFGCDPDRPDARFDCMGLVLLLDRCEVVAIDEHGADLVTNSGARQRFRRRFLPAGTISLWELASR